MPKRTVKTALATYRSAKDVPGSIAYRGDEVDVHQDDVERFDELNVQPGGDDDVEPLREPVAMVSPGAGPKLSGTDSGLNTVVTEEEAGESTAEDDVKDAESEDKPKAARRAKADESK